MTPDPVFQDDDVTVWLGDCRDVLATLPDDCVHAVVCDPPYDLTAGKKGGTGLATRNLDNPYGRARIGAANGGFMGKDWDATGVAFDPATWAEVLRVLKPGGHLLAFGAPRTYHRLAVAIEDAGFDIRDSLHWHFGSGFPKSMDVSKAIDKAAGAEREVIGHTSAGASSLERVRRVEMGYRENLTNVDTANIPITAPATEAARTWAGWGTALKPSHEPIVLARKPFQGPVAANVIAHGTGALNIDACRVGADARPLRISGGTDTPGKTVYGSNGPGGGSRAVGTTDDGRWPPNTVLTHSATCVQVGERVLRGDLREGGTGTREPGFGDVRGRTDGNGEPAGPLYGNETVAVFDCAPDCPVAELDRQSGVLTSGKMMPTHTVAERNVYGQNAAGGYTTMETYGDSGGASRFFPVFRYEAKAPQHERPSVDGVSHPTVKPLDLMRWLVRLVTPVGGLVLDPFLGSGTTAEAAILEGRRCWGVELTPDHVPLIRARLSKPMQTALFAEEA